MRRTVFKNSSQCGGARENEQKKKKISEEKVQCGALFTDRGVNVEAAKKRGGRKKAKQGNITIQLKSPNERRRDASGNVGGGGNPKDRLGKDETHGSFLTGGGSSPGKESQNDTKGTRDERVMELSYSLYNSIRSGGAK